MADTIAMIQIEDVLPFITCAALSHVMNGKTSSGRCA